MVMPVNSLMNMEMQLYGQLSPYTINQLQTNPDFSKSVFQNNVNNGNLQQNTSVPAGTPLQNLSTAQINALTNFYAKNLEPSESLINAVISGAGFGAFMMNPRILAHPWNYLTTTFNGDTNKMFKGVKNGALKDVWAKNNVVLEEAFSQMHRAEARSKWKLGLFRNRYTKQEYNELKRIMQEALDSKDAKKIAEATEKLRYAYCRNGKIFQGWNGIKNFFSGNKTNKVMSPLEMINSEAGKKAIAENTKTLMGYNKMTLKGAFKKAGGKIGLAFGLLEIVMNWSKIQSAFSKDKENEQKGLQSKFGQQQLKQTTTKAVCNTLGWAAGETLGVWGMAKAGAVIGTSVSPLVGTAIGAIIGLIGGSAGMWCANKIAKSMVGDDVSNKIEAEKLTQTTEGQTELLKYTLEKMQNGEYVDPVAQQAIIQTVNRMA